MARRPERPKKPGRSSEGPLDWLDEPSQGESPGPRSALGGGWGQQAAAGGEREPVADPYPHPDPGPRADPLPRPDPGAPAPALGRRAARARREAQQAAQSQVGHPGQAQGRQTESRQTESSQTQGRQTESWQTESWQTQGRQTEGRTGPDPQTQAGQGWQTRTGPEPQTQAGQSWHNLPTPDPRTQAGQGWQTRTGPEPRTRAGQGWQTPADAPTGHDWATGAEHGWPNGTDHLRPDRPNSPPDPDFGDVEAPVPGDLGSQHSITPRRRRGRAGPSDDAFGHGPDGRPVADRSEPARSKTARPQTARPQTHRPGTHQPADDQLEDDQLEEEAAEQTRPRRRKVAFWLTVAALMLALWSATSFIDSDSVVVAGLAAIGPLVTVVALPVIAIGVASKHVVPTAIAVVAAMLPWTMVTGYAAAGPGRHTVGSDSTLRVMTVDGARGRASAADIAQVTRLYEVDIVVVTELTSELTHELTVAGLASLAPARSVEVPTTGGHGTGIWSRPNINKITSITGLSRPGIDGAIEAGPTEIGISVVHLDGEPMRPGPRWRADLSELAQRPLPAAESFIVGDLNAGPWHPAFRKLTGSRWRDAANVVGQGLRPTWPSWAPLPIAPVDHVLVSPGIGVTGADTTAIAGSNHRALIVTLVIPHAGG
jgi:endonuclease/exonuclease/phosphatase (EEP) superfamily protein YafD